MPERIDALVSQVADLTDEIRRVREHYKVWGRWTLIILLAIALAQIGGGVLAVWLVGQNRQRVDDIQQSRREVTLKNCQERNLRNVRTKRLVRKTDDLRPGSKGVILQLVDQLVPFQDCKKEVKGVGLDK